MTKRNADFLSLRAWIGISLVIFVFYRIFFTFQADLNPDEAYYWLWSQQLDLSYHDHPAAVAYWNAAVNFIAKWIQGSQGSIKSSSAWILRLPPLLTSLLSVGMVAHLAMWMQDANEQNSPVSAIKPSTWYLGALAILTSCPILMVFLAFAWPDHSLIFGLLLSLCGFLKGAHQKSSEGKFNSQGRAWMRLGALGLGIAALSKYSSLWLALGYLGFWVKDPKLRIKFWTEWVLWECVFICLIFVSPTLIWNFQNDFRSFKFHFSWHSDSVFTLQGSIKHFFTFVIPWLLTTSPFWLIGLSDQKRKNQSINSRMQLWNSLFPWLFWLPSLAFCALSFHSMVLYYWNIVALVPLWIQRTANVFEKRTRQYLPMLELIYSAIVLGGFFIHSYVLPINTYFNISVDDDTGMLYGWKEVSQALNSKSTGAIEHLACTDYRLGSLLAHSIGSNEVWVYSERPSQFEFWQKFKTPPHQKPLQTWILFDHWHPITNSTRSLFGTSLKSISIPIKSYEYEIKTLKAESFISK